MWRGVAARQVPVWMPSVVPVVQIGRTQRPRHRAEQRRIDDAPEPLRAGDGQAVHRHHATAGQHGGEVIRVVGRIDDQQRAGMRAGQQPAFQQAGVEAQDGIGRFDVAAHADGPFGHAQVGADGRAAARTAITGKTLHLQALREEGRGQQVAGGLRTLAATALDDDLPHADVSLFCALQAGAGRI